MRAYLVVLSVFLILVLVSAIAFAEIPRLITYQGRLTDDTGMPVADGDYDIIFALFPDSTDNTTV
ncbi:hypothetical protein ACFLQW_01385 [Candidatus Zixiibacteriota bacterium]